MADVARNWALEREFEPALNSETRNRLYAGWKKAVTRSQIGKCIRRAGSVPNGHAYSLAAKKHGTPRDVAVNPSAALHRFGGVGFGFCWNICNVCSLVNR